MIWEHSARKCARFSQRIPRHEFEIRLIGQSSGFKTLAGAPALEVTARDPPQFRIHKIYQAVQGVGITIFPSREHSGDIVLVLVRHAGRNLSEKTTAR